MLPWGLRCVLGGNRSESWILISYSTLEQGYLVLVLIKYALLLYLYKDRFTTISNVHAILIDNTRRHHITSNRQENKLLSTGAHVKKRETGKI